jgi:hypothetical protein
MTRTTSILAYAIAVFLLVIKTKQRPLEKAGWKMGVSRVRCCERPTFGWGVLYIGMVYCDAITLAHRVSGGNTVILHNASVGSNRAKTSQAGQFIGLFSRREIRGSLQNRRSRFQQFGKIAESCVNCSAAILISPSRA